MYLFNQNQINISESVNKNFDMLEKY